jgi:hypothetical protein
MAKTTFLSLVQNQKVLILKTRHVSGAVKDFISTNNVYPNLQLKYLQDPQAEDEVVEIVSLINGEIDTDHEKTINDDFDGTLEILSHSIIAWELTDGLPSLKP